MARINKAQEIRGYRGFLKTGDTPVATYEGGIGFQKDAKTELFTLGVTSFYGEDTFYEAAKERNDRFVALIHEVAVSDPEWIKGFIPWLRKSANIRTAAIVAALEATHAFLQNDIPGGRGLIANTLDRADEPGEALAYWRLKYGRNLPKPIKRGIAEAAVILYSQNTFIKYGERSNDAYSFADVINMTHPIPLFKEQSDLFKYALDVRYNPASDYSDLRMIRNNRKLMTIELERRRDYLLSNSVEMNVYGITWEQIAGWLQGPMDAEVWEIVIPHMGYMALLRNLRNFEEAGINKDAVEHVQDILSNSERVQRSRQFPFRFFSAYKNTNSFLWQSTLETALDLSLKNIPELKGRTLVLVDTSGSMQSALSEKSSIWRVEAAALFGAALGKRNIANVDVIGFADETFMFPIRSSSPLLSIVKTFNGLVGSVGHGTHAVEALNSAYLNHDRVIVITDMQFFPENRPGTSMSRPGSFAYNVPAKVPVYVFDTSGYNVSGIETKKNRYLLGGLNDNTFKYIPYLENGAIGLWPWDFKKTQDVVEDL